MAKPKVASDWLAGCAGCHMSFLDMDERIIELTKLVDLRATPITDLKEPDEDGVTVGILEGGISNSYNEEVAIRMRERCQILVALGDCAVLAVFRQCATLLVRTKRSNVLTSKVRADESGKIPDDRNCPPRNMSVRLMMSSKLMSFCPVVPQVLMRFSMYSANLPRAACRKPISSPMTGIRRKNGYTKNHN